jgi:membrane fusion protein, multidrug efflux system
MTKKSKIILFSLLGIVILGIIFLPKIINRKAIEEPTGLNSEKPKQRDRQSLHVNATVLTYQKLTDIFRTKGQLLPDEEVDLSFETSGKITDIFFKEGTFVKKGTLLAKVNDKPLLAELKKLEAQIPLAQERVNRQRTLLEKDAVSQEAYQAVTTDLEKLQADIQLVKARINQTELRAPFDGVVGLRWLSEGAFASTGTSVARLTKISPLKIEFSVNEKQANSIKPGTVIHFTIENDSSRYQARVYAVETTLDEKTLSLKARALYANTSGKLKPGHSASIDIILREIDDAVVIPSIASIAEMGRDIAFIYKNGKAKQVELKKGLRTASSVQVTQGLEVGDTLLVTGVMQLRDGSEVILDKITKN